MLGKLSSVTLYRCVNEFSLCFDCSGGYFFVELIWGIKADSLALVADALHMLSGAFKWIYCSYQYGCIVFYMFE